MKLSAQLSLLAAVTLGLFTACASLRTVNVKQDAGLAGASVSVDIVPITDKNVNLETVSVREYWRPGSGLRNSANVATIRFGAGQPETQTVSKDWQKLGAKKVVVFADLPGVFADLPGDSDPRRKSIAVQKAAAVTVRISPSGLSVESP